MTEETPLFGQGSAPSKRTQQRPAFARPDNGQISRGRHNDGKMPIKMPSQAANQKAVLATPPPLGVSGKALRKNCDPQKVQLATSPAPDANRVPATAPNNPNLATQQQSIAQRQAQQQAAQQQALVQQQALAQQQILAQQQALAQQQLLAQQQAQQLAQQQAQRQVQQQAGQLGTCNPATICSPELNPPAVPHPAPCPPVDAPMVATPPTPQVQPQIQTAPAPAQPPQTSSQPALAQPTAPLTTAPLAATPETGQTEQTAAVQPPHVLAQQQAALAAQMVPPVSIPVATPPTAPLISPQVGIVQPVANQAVVNQGNLAGQASLSGHPPLAAQTAGIAPQTGAGVPVPPVAGAPVSMPPVAQTGNEEDRTERRKRTLKGGVIILPGHMRSSYACKIRNESNGGVMLALPNTAVIPNEFFLMRDSDPGRQTPCRVAWRTADKLGVQFVLALSN